MRIPEVEEDRFLSRYFWDMPKVAISEHSVLINNISLPPSYDDERKEDYKILARKIAPNFPFAIVDVHHGIEVWDKLLLEMKDGYVSLDDLEDTFRTVCGAAMQRGVRIVDIIGMVSLERNPNASK